MDIIFREAAHADAAAIASIYNQGIQDRGATFETTLRTPKSTAGWMANGSTS
jgi:phosphinothricin acetyltransferase